MPGRQSIDPVKAVEADALVAAGYANVQVERMIGIDEASVRDIVQRRGRWSMLDDAPVLARLREETTRAIEVGIRAHVIQSLVEANSPDKIKSASYRDLMVGVGIGIDKMRLLAGESTANVDLHVQVTAVDDLAGILSQALLVNPVDNSQVK